ncbi:hypothetical protein FB45DRAFT_260623 [Roridomyces roridus]|uniref:DUF6533 domain-containing protein n=1 Tax=Roridomyces roridus TaxID=1738132 RepID=A0AAD7B8R9_9AGAR|nr:hypothetical protein FB45DRAFT_260623 [Roridomyces roridus]
MHTTNLRLLATANAGPKTVLMSTISPATTTAGEAALFQLIADSQTTNYLAAAAITLVILEHISAFKEEIEYVWKSRLSLWSVLYVWTRYATLTLLVVDAIFMFRPMSTSKVDAKLFSWYSHSQDSEKSCLSIGTPQSEVFSSTMMIISVDCVLVLRVWLLLGRAKKFPFIMIPLLIVEGLVMVTFGILTILPIKDFVDVGPILNGCYAFEVPRVMTFYPVAPFLMALLMFSITVYKCGQHIQYIMRVRSNTEPMSMITLFLRDGVFLFLWLVVVATAEIIIWRKDRPTLAEIPIIPATAIPAVLAARILLNIKNLAYHTDSTVAGTSIEFTTVLSQSLPPSRGIRVPWYLRTGEVNDIRSEEM